MCTIIILNQVHPDFPVVVAGNRDEFYARATRPPEVIREQPLAVAGVDVEHGGTWMGATGGGFFAGLTNQRDHQGSNDPALTSRGEVVTRLLAAGESDAARALVASLDPASYNPFNLVFGDADQVTVAYARRDRDTIELCELPPGLSILPNDRIDSPDFPKVDRARELIAPHLEASWPELVAALQTSLADHQLPALTAIPEPPVGARFNRATARLLQALCIHTPAYGTRSTSVIALTRQRVAHYLYADGPPCRAKLIEQVGLFAG